MSWSLPKLAEDYRITACVVWLNVGPTLAKVTGEWQYNQYRRVCVDEGLDGSALFPSGTIITSQFFISAWHWQFSGYNMNFFLFVFRSVNDWQSTLLCYYIIIQIWVTCSTLSHCRLVSNFSQQSVIIALKRNENGIHQNVKPKSNFFET